MPRIFSIVVLVVILIAIGVIFFRVMSGFLVPVFLAALLGVIFHPLHIRVDQRFGKQSRYVSAGITTLVAAFAVVAPAASRSSRWASSKVSDWSTSSATKRCGTRQAVAPANATGNPAARGPAQDRVDAQLRRRRHQPGRNAPHRNGYAVEPVPASERLAIYVEKHPEEMPGVDPVPLKEALNTLEVSPPGLLEFDDALLNAKIAFREFRLKYLGNLTRLAQGVGRSPGGALDAFRPPGFPAARRC